MPVRAVIDTNIWISSLLNPTGFPAKLRTAFQQGIFVVIVSEPILREIADVLSRPRIRDKCGVTEADIKELITLIEERADHTLLSGTVDVCRDKDDNLVIETAINGNAEYIVSRDDDVKFDKEVSRYLSQHGISAVTIRRFLKLIE